MRTQGSLIAVMILLAPPLWANGTWYHVSTLR